MFKYYEDNMKDGEVDRNFYNLIAILRERIKEDAQQPKDEVNFSEGIIGLENAKVLESGAALHLANVSISSIVGLGEGSVASGSGLEYGHGSNKKSVKFDSEEKKFISLDDDDDEVV